MRVISACYLPTIDRKQSNLDAMYRLSITADSPFNFVELITVRWINAVNTTCEVYDMEK